MVMVIECDACHSRFRLAKSLFKESRAIRVRCRKCGGYIVVENPDLHEPSPETPRQGPRAVPRVVPPPEPKQEREQEQERKRKQEQELEREKERKREQEKEREREREQERERERERELAREHEKAQEPLVLTPEPVADTIREEPEAAPAPETPKAEPTPELPVAAPAPETPKAEPTPELPVAAPAPETPKAEPVPEILVAAPAPEKPKAEAPPADDSAQAMADLMRGIDAETAGEPPEELPWKSTGTPAEKVPEKPIETPAEEPAEVSPPPSDLPPELTAPDAGSGRKTGYKGPVRVTPCPDHADGSEALASVLDDLFKSPPEPGTAAGPASQAEPSTAAEPRKPSVPREPPRAHPSRPPYASPLFIFIVFLWLALLAGAAFLFGTDYFDKWLGGAKPPATERAVPGKAVKPSYQIADLNWFIDNAFNGGTLFAVTGTVTNLGNVVNNGIRVRATIMGKDNQVIAQKDVFAGNQLDNTTLRHTKRDIVDSFLSRMAEEGTANREIAAGDTLPFMAVFYDPPERVYSVVVKAVSAKGE